MKLAPKDAREARELLADLSVHANVPTQHRIERLLGLLDRGLAPRAKAKAFRAATKAAKKAKSSARQQVWGDVYSAVATRSGGCCEACGEDEFVAPLECDHFFGRARAQSVETCWMLCRGCHRKKTDGSPTSAWWFRRFIEHAHALDYRAAMALAEKRLAFVEARSALGRRAG
jgi:5-methylcytosine-specific restriction endonuclease McrA